MLSRIQHGPIRRKIDVFLGCPNWMLDVERWTLSVFSCMASGASEPALSLSNRSAAEFAPRRWPARPSLAVVSLCPKQLPWKLLAQFSLSRERDVANIIA